MSKNCSICKIHHPDTEYLYYPTRKYYDNRCNSCRKKEKKEEYQRNKHVYITRASVYQIQYRVDNKESIADNRKKYRKIQRETNPQFFLKERLSSRLKNVLRSNKLAKSEETSDLLGCSIPFLKEYLSNKFYGDMSWELRNFEIDHIVPCCWFDLTVERQRRYCFSYKNLQPLTKLDNLKKYNKVWVKYNLNKNPYI